MIQDIAPHTLCNVYDPQAVPSPGDPLLCLEGDRVLVRRSGGFPVCADACGGSQTFLFRLDGRPFFTAPVPGPVPEHMELVRIGELRKQKCFPREEMYALLTAKHLADWYADSRFCGHCGAATVPHPTERARKCPSCGRSFYPRIMPAVIVGVKHGDRLLLTKYRQGIDYHALIAGFVEIGETAEETVAREVMEETGLRVKNIRYYKTQPWGIANDLLLGYYCELDGDDETIHMDPQELRYAAFVSREEICLQPDDYSLTNEMMTRFKLGLER